MQKLLLIGILALAVVGGLASANRSVSAQFSTPAPLPSSGAAGSQQSSISPNALTNFTISNPYCYQPDPSLDECSINFRFIQATDNQSSAPFMTWMAILINSKVRFSETAFFEGTITYSYDMVPNGLKVPCGLPNAGGAGTRFGNVYGVYVEPLDSSRNAMSTDIANVTCPAFAP